MSRYTFTSTGRSLLPAEARRLISPLAISLVLHALAFSPAPGVLPSPDSPAARQSDLRAQLHRPVAAAPIDEPVVVPAAPTKKTPMRQPEKRIHPSPVSPPAPAPVAVAVAESPVEPERAAGPPPDQAIEATKTGVDVAGLRQYHLALGQKARQFRRYPEAARAAGQQGRVRLRLAVSANGSPLATSLLGSSSFGILDEAALEMMLLAARHTEVPARLRGQAFSIDLAVDYDPEDTP